MKKPQLLAVAASLLALSASPVAAQAVFGAQGGVSIATINFDTDTANEGVDTRTGMHVGLFVDFPLTPGIGLRPGLYYTSGGAGFSEGGVDADLTLDYVQIPVLLRFGVPLNMPFSVHALAGPYVGFEAACEVDDNVSDPVDCEDESLDGLTLKSTDFGVQLGAGLGFGVAEGINLLLEGGYQFGLTDMQEVESEDGFKHRRWLVDLGLTVGLSR